MKKIWQNWMNSKLSDRKRKQKFERQWWQRGGIFGKRHSTDSEEKKDINTNLEGRK